MRSTWLAMYAMSSSSGMSGVTSRSWATLVTTRWSAEETDFVSTIIT
ncbi:MAG: hypothetical protein LKJ82_02865 [Atopobiaceae bacterium]|nr:hypothetical protein [Atopobiaceae bacterium]